MAAAAMNGARRKPVTITKSNVQHFLNEFDALVSDCDGVIWTPSRDIPNSREGLQSLRAAGKKILFATNNSFQSLEKKFQKLGFEVQPNEVVYPSIAIAQHLRNIGFKKKAFVLGGERFKDEIRNVGVDVLPYRGKTMEPTKEDLPTILRQLDDNHPEIGAVVVDFDVNLTYMDLSKAINYVSKEECLFFAGATDEMVPLHAGLIMIGPGHFLSAIEKATGRKAEVFGKPGHMMVSEFLKDIHGLNMERTVFVGDTLAQDMAAAHSCGMKKLLVLTGLASLRDLDTCDPHLVPDYVIESIGDFAQLLC